MATIQIKRGLQAQVSNLVLAQGELAVALDTGNVYVGTQTGNVHINPAGGTADTAVALQTPRNFSITGDGAAPAVSFDGTQNVQLVFTLADLAGLSAGTYTKLTVNAKGQVTAGASITVEDLPTIPSTQISGLGTAASVNTGTAAGNVPVLQTGGVLLASVLPDLSGTYVPVTTTVNGHALDSNVTVSATDVGAVPASQVGTAGGVASLDSTGKVPAAQLPSYVDDVQEYDGISSFPQTGESGVIYVDTSTNLTYRWSGSQYVEISPSLALGETSSTAFPGDLGKIAYDHSQITDGNPHGVTYSMAGAAPASHVTVQASSSVLGHVMIGPSFTMDSGTLELSQVDGGTF